MEGAGPPRGSRGAGQGQKPHNGVTSASHVADRASSLARGVVLQPDHIRLVRSPPPLIGRQKDHSLALVTRTELSSARASALGAFSAWRSAFKQSLVSRDGY